jgi:hypothetical protein
VVSRFVWESNLWLLPYFLFWVGLVALAVRLVRRGRLGSQPAAGAPATG